MIKKEVKGSFTVEAAFIFPSVLFIIIALIYMGFYMHDKAKINSDINETLLKGKNLVLYEADINTGLIDYDAYLNRGILYSLEGNMEDYKTEISDYINKSLDNGLFIASINQVEVNVTYSSLSVEINASMKFPFLEIKKYFTGTGTQIILDRSLEVNSTPEFIRIFDVFSGVVDKMPLIDETLQKLQEILGKIK